LSTFVIAEAGVNHNGSHALALQLVDAAADAGADAVKFQTFKADQLVSRQAPKADYQKRNTAEAESQLDMLRRLELAPEFHRELLERCRQRGIAFLSTPFELDSLAFLVNDLGLSLLKLPSGELTNAPFLLAAARTGTSIILSTGMADMVEVEQALGVLAAGYLGMTPSRHAFAAAWASPEGRAAVAARVTLLHCTTEYPAPFASVNLRAMDSLAQRFGLPAGLSDHTTGISIAIAAAARGARVIEKHFTLDRALPGPDHAASLEPDELAVMVRSIREVETALGDGDKQPQACELANRAVARKSLVAARPIRAGEIFNADNVAIKRPGTGRSPMDYFDLLGQPASRDYAADEVLA
jgi:N-acetylneuraminate synthase